MKYQHLQFVTPVQFSRAPWLVLKDTYEQPANRLTMEDVGNERVSITDGTTTIQVPWSNIASAVPAPVPVPVEVPAAIRDLRNANPRGKR